MSKKSAVLYQNPQHTVFLIDVPASIELAQVPSRPSSASSNPQDSDDGLTNPTGNCKEYSYLGRQLLSSKPLEKPYPSPPEPKSQAARARLLARIPESEILFHESIAPFAQEGLDEIKTGFEGVKWCRSRKVHSALDGGDVHDDNSGDNNPRGALHRQEETGPPPRKKVKKASNSNDERSLMDLVKYSMQPPLILSSSSINEFSSLSDLRGIHVKNSSDLEPSIIRTGKPDGSTRETKSYTIPPGSSFILDTISATQPYPHLDISPVSGLSPQTDKFNIILFDPPWPNRSVRRSSQYQTHGYLEMDSLIAIMQRTILTHLNFGDETKKETAIVGIWTTNNAKSRQAAYTAFESTGLEVCEVWIWIKITENGELVSPLNGLWRKPYEVLFLGRPKEKEADGGQRRQQDHEPLKRIMAAVPDKHSRKPNLKELFESLFFHIDEDKTQASHTVATQNYTALEVFARNLTAGWSACGNDILKFNADEWWFQP